MSVILGCQAYVSFTLAAPSADPQLAVAGGSRDLAPGDATVGLSKKSLNPEENRGLLGFRPKNADDTVNSMDRTLGVGLAGWVFTPQMSVF